MPVTVATVSAPAPVVAAAKPAAKAPAVAVPTAQLVRPTAAKPAVAKPAVATVVGATVVGAPRVVNRPKVVFQPKPAAPPPAAAKPHTHLEVTISNDLAELARLAGLVEDYVERQGLPDRIAFNLNLCLDELITNIVSYGYDDSHHHDIHVRFSLDNGRLITEIFDDGKEYNPFTETPEPDVELDVDDRPIGGLGVFLVKEFMDRTDYRREGGKNVVTLEKNVTEQES